jgi:hypothetical protein
MKPGERVSIIAYRPMMALGSSVVEWIYSPIVATVADHDEIRNVLTVRLKDGTLLALLAHQWRIND